VMIKVSVDRSGEKRIARSAPDNIGSRIDGKPHDGTTDAWPMPTRTGRNQELTDGVQPLFCRESDLSLPRAGFA
jgi:hypothetical protein